MKDFNGYVTALVGAMIANAYSGTDWLVTFCLVIIAVLAALQAFVTVIDAKQKETDPAKR